MSPASAAPRSAPTPPQLRNPLRSALTKAPLHPAHLPRPHPRSATRDESVVVGRQTHIVREVRSPPPSDGKGSDGVGDDGKKAAGAGARHFVVDATSSPPTPSTDSQQPASWGLPPHVYALDHFSAPRPDPPPAKLAQQQPARPRQPSSHLPSTSLEPLSIPSHIRPPFADDAASTTRNSSSGAQPSSLPEASQQQPAARRRTASLTTHPLSSPPALPTLLEEGEEGELSLLAGY